ncbi:uncharacterized protein EI97DRAFT_53385 [Westerdykella ornata]|uniref:Uncharacterized protein n=1 Tax=Westerdykella ornata TaxID=318751 RepID=A0A6A6JIJ1_WESOR|nr:uncharacterized protein EI97DRAFT_53385 [Westerdykella ornata]KAF2276247.1 hypothetical protein EI97DRAFT_53385 [Westerdykella ornata]
MAFDDPRLKYLREAARILAVSSPAVSAELGATRIRLLEERDADLEATPKERDALRRELCVACGNLLLPGWSCSVAHESRSRNPIKKKEGDAMEMKPRCESDLVYTCLRCHRRTEKQLPLPPPRRTQIAGRPSRISKPAPMAQSDGADRNKGIKTANASSKQRAKARKGGLQAMLAKSKSQNSTSQGLDLMDFMQ